MLDIDWLDVPSLYTHFSGINCWTYFSFKAHLLEAFSNQPWSFSRASNVYTWICFQYCRCSLLQKGNPQSDKRVFMHVNGLSCFSFFGFPFFFAFLCFVFSRASLLLSNCASLFSFVSSFSSCFFLLLFFFFFSGADLEAAAVKQSWSLWVGGSRKRQDPGEELTGSTAPNYPFKKDKLVVWKFGMPRILWERGGPCQYASSQPPLLTNWVVYGLPCWTCVSVLFLLPNEMTWILPGTPVFWGFLRNCSQHPILAFGPCAFSKVCELEDDLCKERDMSNFIPNYMGHGFDSYFSLLEGRLLKAKVFSPWKRWFPASKLLNNQCIHYQITPWNPMTSHQKTWNNPLQSSSGGPSFPRPSSSRSFWASLQIALWPDSSGFGSAHR